MSRVTQLPFAEDRVLTQAPHRLSTRLDGLIACMQKRRANRGRIPLAVESRCGVELWRAARRWRRAVEATLAPAKLTLVQWAVLTATARVVQETRDAASQNAVAACAQLDRVTVCMAMKALEQSGFVDRAPSAIGRSNRVWVTSAGARALEVGASRVQAASQASFGPQASLTEHLLASLRRVV